MVRLARYCGCSALFAAIILAPASAATADAIKFETHLLPSPVSDLTAASVTGSGLATATLDHNKLTVRGTFDGLATPATDCHLFAGPGIGIPGKPLLNLTISPAANGTISGEFELSSQQVTALKQGHLYIQIDGQNAETPYGALWGWLLPDHATVAQGVPEEGHWFLPQYDVPQGK